jgi:hypothetical protein
MDLTELNPVLDKRREEYQGDLTEIGSCGVSTYFSIELIASALGRKYV